MPALAAVASAIISLVAGETWGPALIRAVALYVLVWLLLFGVNLGRARSAIRKQRAEILSSWRGQYQLGLEAELRGVSLVVAAIMRQTVRDVSVLVVDPRGNNLSPIEEPSWIDDPNYYESSALTWQFPSDFGVRHDDLTDGEYLVVWHVPGHAEAIGCKKFLLMAGTFGVQ